MRDVLPGHRWIRRNAVIELREVGAELRIFKKYHSAYSAHDEILAYQRLAPVADQIPNVRIPSVILADAIDELQREYVHGPTLRAMLLMASRTVLRYYLPTIVQLFAASQRAGICFDADPSNFIVSGPVLVLIDPMMKPLGLEHPAAIIFLFGVIKLVLVRPWLVARLAHVFRQTLALYRAETGVDVRTLYRELGDYISRVIVWNREDVVAEGRLHRSFRRYALIPVYALIRAAVRRMS